MADDGVIVAWLRATSTTRAANTNIDRRYRCAPVQCVAAALAWQDTQLLLHLVPLDTRIGGGRVLLELPSCAKSCTRARTYQVCMKYELPCMDRSRRSN